MFKITDMLQDELENEYGCNDVTYHALPGTDQLEVRTDDGVWVISVTYRAKQDIAPVQKKREPKNDHILDVDDAS